jgi:Alkylmercury lyase
MDLTVLAVPDCPNVMLLEERLAQVLEGRRDVTVSRQVIADQDEATRRGMHGSPTILVDGIDPFAEPGQPASVSCRLYRDGNGQVDGAPSLSQLRQAIGEAAAPAADAGTPSWLDALGRGGRGRRSPAERGLRPVHQAVLRSFAATGRGPEQGLLDEAAKPFDVRQILTELAEGDFLCLDQAGRISAAYPFSAAATPHTVQITDRVSAYAMCAIDALGIAEMLHTSVLIMSADPSNGEPITVTLDGSSAGWNPAATVVFVGRTADQCAGPSAAICCDHVNFFSSRPGAEAWASAHPEITGGILSQDRAVEVAGQIFGQLLCLSESGLARARGLRTLADSSGFPEDKISQLRNCALFTCIGPSRLSGRWHDGPR